MKLKIHENVNGKIIEVISDDIVLRNEKDVISFIEELTPLEANKIFFHKENIISDFFILRTRLAGEILQKFVNYYIKVAIVGDFKKITSQTLKAFIYESNRGTQIFFLEDVGKAITKLAEQD
jgi:hypothetical protein